MKNSDIKWLEEARANVKQRVKLKNRSTYVDVSQNGISLPRDAITKNDAATMIERAVKSLSAHWRTEGMVNPLLLQARKEAGVDEPLEESGS